jgi:hypothetical protein
LGNWESSRKVTQRSRRNTEVAEKRTLMRTGEKKVSRSQVVPAGFRNRFSADLCDLCVHFRTMAVRTTDVLAKPQAAFP